MRRIKIAVFALTLAIGLIVSPVFAIGQPSSITMDSARAFASVLESGDLLFLGQFTVSYTNCNSATTTGCPSETIEEAYLGHLLATDGVTPIRSALTVLSGSHTFNGYGSGVFSIYVSASDVTALGIVASTNHFLQVGGNPTLFGSVPQNTIGVSSELSKSTLGTSILNRAANLENSWDFNLLTSSDAKLNGAGADYFAEAVPNLRLMAPSIFQASVDSPTFNESQFGTDTRDDFLAFGAGTAFIDNANAQFANLETAFGLPATIIKTLIGLAAGILSVMAVTQATGDSRIGTLGFAITFPLGVIMGYGVLEFVAIVVLFAAIGIAWVVFLKTA